MLPTSLASIYRQYKQDIDSVAFWLASTAESCGYSAHLRSNLSPKSGEEQAPKPTGRLKGKARAKARAEGGSKTPSNSEPGNNKNTTKHIIAMKDFLPLATFIAGRHDPPVSVPEVFSTTIDRLIACRSSFGGRLKNSGFKLTTKSNERLSCVVAILEKVRDVLRPITTGGAASDKGNDASNESTNSLGGSSAALSVDEPTESVLEMFRHESHKRPTPLKEDTILYEAEPETSFEDVLFAFTLLANDLKIVRSRITWIWSKHRDGIFDLAAAAVATNAALSIARGLIEEVTPLLETQKGGVWIVLRKLYFLVCIQKGYKRSQIILDKKKDTFNYDTYEEANDCYFIANRLMESFVKIRHPKQLPLVKEGTFGRYDPQIDRASKTGQQKFKEDRFILMNFFTELITTIRLVPKYPVEDEFMREMIAFDKTPIVSFSLVFAAQVFLDIHHTMLAATRESYLTAIEEVGTMNNLLVSHLDFHRNLKLDNQAPSNDRQLQALSSLMSWMSTDPVHASRAKMYREMGLPVPPGMGGNRILAYSPILGGLYLFRMRTEMYELGFTVANAWGSIAYSAHLYNALLGEGLLEGQWDDMEIITEILGQSSLWVGGVRPKTLPECFQNFCRQMGVTAAAFTSSRQRKNAIASLAGPQRIEKGPLVSSMFGKQICTKAKMVWTSELLDSIVAQSNYQIEGSAETGDLNMAKAEVPKELGERHSFRKQKEKARATGKDHTIDNLAPEKLIEMLVMELNSESIQMAFPWLFMHRWCWNLLRTVRDSCDPALRERYTFAYMQKESELPWVVGYILKAASGFDGPPDVNMLNITADVFNGLIATKANKVGISIARSMGKEIAM